MALAPPQAPGLDPTVLAAAVRRTADAGAITFLVDGDAVTYAAEGDAVVVSEGRQDGATAVRLSRHAWDDVVGQLRTFVNLLLSDDLTFERGGFRQVSDWDPVLRYLYGAVPPYDPARSDLGGRDPQATFTLDAGDDELAAHLRAVGYLHVRGVFGAGEMAAANAEVDRLAAEARPGDDRSWWAT